ncbi:hypothetical protein CSW60_11550 [Caulobacter sp. X]|nr:hypothetical protein CSW60_11550 [Caulobacter sp. X]
MASARMAAVEAEGVTAAMLVAVAVPAAAMVMMMSSKHELHVSVSLYRNCRYIEIGVGQELFRYI